MKRLLFLGLTLLSMFCLTSCQSSDFGYGKKDDKSTQVDQNKTTDKENNKPPKKEEHKPPVKVFTPVENDAFKVTSVVNDAEKNVLLVEGKASVFEATFLYRLEDGHNVLAEGNSMTDMGAPEWGNFKLEIKYTEPTSPNGILTLYVASAKDGQPEHILNIPIQLTK
ncbi:Gmad2 immunoglobulin-like domain-containing protein [Gottfriedia luciferensis]|uniref:Gmad2 immunoglobulin-like domain-containing protein n=1 Tax=Gottfriedia luciferensis TaxID=178774 RepID=UPI000B44637D|nr:Gmad2 immunoglobulin-like domain-containing protein [Gottfriedia luciferensis]